MIKIICCGNRDRGDDGAGLLVADRLAALGVSVERCLGETAELISAWEGAPEVVMVDAVVTGTHSGTIHRWDANKSELPTSVPSSTHGMGLGKAIELARVLGTLPPRLEVFGIEARQFTLGSEASFPVRQAAEHLAKTIAAWHLSRCFRQSESQVSG